jgi:hypothetical protein
MTETAAPDTIVEATVASTRQCEECAAGRRCERLGALKRAAWDAYD